MKLFRPCIDIHQGKVKQIIGATLGQNLAEIKENFVSQKSALTYAELYYQHQLSDGHIIMLDQSKSTRQVALETIKQYPNFFHLGGGMNIENALSWLEAGAKKIIFSSYLFDTKTFSLKKLIKLSQRLGKEKIIIDLSTMKAGEHYYAAINGWQTITSFKLSQYNFDLLMPYCDELLIHAIEKEGKSQGMDENLLHHLKENCKLPLVYAGGINSFEEIAKIKKISQGHISYTIGSSLDIFGGHLQFSQIINT